MTESNPPDGGDPEELREPELSDEDILDGMARIPGYLDITTEDFRTLYHLAHRHAVERLIGHIRADRLMRPSPHALSPDLPLDAAAGVLVGAGIMSLPVVEADGRVIGVLTETDFFRRLGVKSFIELILRLLEDPSGFTHRFHETSVRDAMTSPAVTVTDQAGFRQIAAAFHRHEGRATPVVDGQGRLRGLLLRKDFLGACHWPEVA